MPERMTAADKKYVARFRGLGRAVKRLLPEWELYAFDPDLTFIDVDGRQHEVPVQLAEAIQRELEIRDAT